MTLSFSTASSGCTGRARSQLACPHFGIAALRVQVDSRRICARKLKQGGVRLRVTSQRGNADAPLTATVVGGGLGGLALAIALRREGVDARVYERALELRSNAGTGIVLWPNGIKALRGIAPELADAAIDAGCVIKGIGFGKASAPDTFKEKVVGAGMKVAGGLMARSMEWKYGAPMVAIRWSALQQVLSSFLPPDCIELDANFKGYQVLPEGAGVRTDFCRRDGAPLPAVTTDVLVGADGLRSAVRAQMLGDSPPRDGGRVLWRAVVDGACLPQRQSLCPASGTRLLIGEGRTASFMDVGSGQVYWAAGALDGTFDADPSLVRRPACP
ncbi:hypothetical protein CYMTET_55747 [Cymbomonas tetramitiformis]|uniref:FAD-binding domain-containing protein n=1 Tax=Cymbomonas tetramitiformis TaxID=36881 RepID=A0AAE0BCP8_9CHLO|nr:hypothetical protein CYMTET_55747 [Cymbomonas tetramitiformis]